MIDFTASATTWCSSPKCPEPNLPLLIDIQKEKLSWQWIHPQPWPHPRPIDDFAQHLTTLTPLEIKLVIDYIFLRMQIYLCYYTKYLPGTVHNSCRCGGFRIQPSVWRLENFVYRRSLCSSQRGEGFKEVTLESGSSDEESDDEESEERSEDSIQEEPVHGSYPSPANSSADSRSSTTGRLVGDLETIHMGKTGARAPGGEGIFGSSNAQRRQKPAAVSIAEMLTGETPFGVHRVRNECGWWSCCWLTVKTSSHSGVEMSLVENVLETRVSIDWRLGGWMFPSHLPVDDETRIDVQGSTSTIPQPSPTLVASTFLTRGRSDIYKQVWLLWRKV